MPRIPQAEIDRIKREVDLAEQVTRAGVQLARHGKDLIGLCPFHRDTEPSLVVTPSRNLWNCLGACGEGGSVIDWVMRWERVSFRQAVEMLRGGAEPEALPPLFSVEMSDAEILAAAVDFYHSNLLASPEAMPFLESRGLASMEAIRHFKLGYSNRTLGYRLPKRQWKEGAALRDRLQTLGILRSSGHEYFAGSLVVPVIDREGTVTEIYGRKICSDLAKKIPLHTYLPGPHRGIWNLEALAGSKEVILCEALFDGLTFWTHGYHHVTAAYGINGFTTEHLEAMKAYGTERVLIAYDRDDAGEKAARSLAEKLTAEGISCYRVQFPRGMDANEFALGVRPAVKSLGLALQNAVWLGEGKEAEPPSEAASSLAAPPPKPPPELPPPPPASPVASPPLPDLPIERQGDEVSLTVEDRRYRVRGLERNLSHDLMKINLLAASPAGFHVDSLDLYSARQRTAYVKQAAHELQLKEDLVKKDLGRVLVALEKLVDEQIQEALAPKSAAVPTMTEDERAAALALLRDPDLPSRILEDLERCGLVGEATNKLVGYLAAVSRKLAAPLAVIIQSSSAAGKTSLMEGILAMLPKEERVQYSAMTGQSLFYMGETDLSHKVLAIVEEEGAERASYALKLLQSEGELTIASTGKDPKSGRLVTHEYRVEGPVMIFLTTTAVEVDEELLNRAIVLTVDEDRSQTRAIHELQRNRRTLDGLLATTARNEVLTRHRNAQRLLEPLAVVNPYAPQLTFLDDRTRRRRDHEKYLTLIDTIALVHQHQREIRTARRNDTEVRYVEVERSDVDLANQLSGEVFGRTLDELPPQTRRFLERLERQVTTACAEESANIADFRFTARWAREALGAGATQTKVHLARLVDLEYLILHRSQRGQSFVYELLYQGEGESGRRFLPGLVAVESLQDPLTYAREWSGSEVGWSGQNGEWSEGGRPLVGPKSGGGRGAERTAKERNGSDLGPLRSVLSENAHLESSEIRPPIVRT